MLMYHFLLLRLVYKQIIQNISEFKECLNLISNTTLERIILYINYENIIKEESVKKKKNIKCLSLKLI